MDQEKEKVNVESDAPKKKGNWVDQFGEILNLIVYSNSFVWWIKRPQNGSRFFHGSHSLLSLSLSLSQISLLSLKSHYFFFSLKCLILFFSLSNLTTFSQMLDTELNWGNDKENEVGLKGDGFVKRDEQSRKQSREQSREQSRRRDNENIHSFQDLLLKF